MRLYEIEADYRPRNPKKSKYYVWVDTVKDAKLVFSNIISWLTIYKVTPVDEEDSNKICNEPDKHIIIGLTAKLLKT